MDVASSINALVSDELNERWRRIQRRSIRKIDWGLPTGKELMAAGHVKLSRSIPFLTLVKHHSAALQSHLGIREWAVPGGNDYATRPGYVLDNVIDLEVPSNLNRLSPASFERTIQLHDFELWVADHLQRIDLHQIDMIKLIKALHKYIDTSLSHYRGNPERLSVAFLTILEIWVFIDHQVIDWLPKLKEYSPEIPVNVLEPLLLPLRCQMERLARVEIYLERRQRESSSKSAIFYNVQDRDSFVSWFVGQSPSLLAVLQEMEHETERQIRQKEVEMESLNSRYRALQSEMMSAFCDKASVVKNGRIVVKHSRWCPKCSKQRALNRMVYVRILFSCLICSRRH
jgi:hypothetical protein